MKFKREVLTASWYKRRHFLLNKSDGNIYKLVEVEGNELLKLQHSSKPIQRSTDRWKWRNLNHDMLKWAFNAVDWDVAVLCLEERMCLNVCAGGCWKMHKFKGHLDLTRVIVFDIYFDLQLKM